MKSSLEPEDLQILNGSKSYIKQVETIEEEEETYKILSQNESDTDSFLMNSSRYENTTLKSTHRQSLRHITENSKKKKLSNKTKVSRGSRNSKKWRTYTLHRPPLEINNETEADVSDGIVNNPIYQSNLDSKSTSENSSEKSKLKNRELIMSQWDLILKKAADQPKNLKNVLSEKSTSSALSSKTKKSLELSITRPDEIVKSFFSYLNQYGEDGCTLRNSLNKSKDKEKSTTFINSIFPIFRKNQTKSDKSLSSSKSSDKNASKCKIKPDKSKKISVRSLVVEEDIDLDKLIEKLSRNEEKLELLKNKLSIYIKSKKNQNFYFGVSPQIKQTLARRDRFFMPHHHNHHHIRSSSTPNPDVIIQNFSNDLKDFSEPSSIENSNLRRQQEMFENFMRQKKFADGKIYEKEFRKIVVQPIEIMNVAVENRKNLKKSKPCTRHKVVQINTKRGVGVGGGGPRVKSSKQILKEISEKCKNTENRVEKKVTVVEPPQIKNSFMNYYYYEDNLLRKENQRHKTNKVKTKKIKSLLEQQPSENIYNDPTKSRFLY
ncbi:unnamed protein product [Brachionus calyciflorus]|uniref:Uncharacterized protein n=1 Tax=Brachionus calyciflorus TaxID=104777 RepID=A0A814J9S4_9BILA|nr:unnamed protein product [Brachionus calyciflorus]